MNYFGKIFSNISQVYSQINPATLTGAIDVIIVEQEDGEYLCSPFHVRFGKMGVLRSREKIVEIEINGVPVDIHMKLGDSGEAYFLEECEDDDDNGDDIEQQTLCSSAELTPPDNNSDDNKQIESIVCTNDDVESSLIVNNTDNSQNDCDKENVKPDETNDISNNIVVAQPEPKSEVASSRNSSTSQNSQKRVRRKKKGKTSGNSRQAISTCPNNPQLIENRTESVAAALNRDSDDEVYLNNYNVKHETESLHHLHSEAFSDSEISQAKYKRSDSSKNAFDCKSDSEYEIFKSNENQVQDQAQDHDNISWDWGELPNVQKDSNPLHAAKKESNDESKNSGTSMLGILNFIKKDKEKEKDDTDKGIYLDDLDPNDMKPEVAAKYFPKFRSSFSSRRNNTSDDDIESGNGASLSNSPNSVEFNYSGIPQPSDFNQFDEETLSSFDLVTINKFYHDMSMSLCGGIENLFSNPNDSERFLQSIISFDDFSENPLQLLENPNLVIRMGGRYYTWKMASSIILSYLMFQRPLPIKTLELLKDHCIPKKKNTPQNSASKSSWRSWFRSNPSNLGEANQNSSDYSSFVMENNIGPINIDTFESSNTSIEASSHSPNSAHEYISDDETINLLLPSNGTRSNSDNKLNGNNGTNKKMKYKKVLRLKSDVIKSLNLRPNGNDVEFSVTTAYQGTTICKSKIFLWRYDDQIVISDIDGTITKSDVLGHILPYIGQDWAQLGVTNLFSNIDNNGYKFLYLSARAIGQARGTREYLRALRQDDVGLPDGPVLLSPTSLLSALHREVIDKKPEEFKIACLNDIQSLFPKNPFFAGFGNKINDTWAYKAVGIDMSRIFTINHKGELKLEKLLSFKSSYPDLSQFVDQMFAPLNQNAYNDEFSSFMYWRSEIPELPEQEIPPK